MSYITDLLFWSYIWQKCNYLALNYLPFSIPHPSTYDVLDYNLDFGYLINHRISLIICEHLIKLHYSSYTVFKLNKEFYVIKLFNFLSKVFFCCIFCAVIIQIENKKNPLKFKYNEFLRYSRIRVLLFKPTLQCFNSTKRRL